MTPPVHPQQLGHLRDKEGVDYVIDEAGCWEWQKGKNSRGYAHGYAYRRYWEAVNGPRPEGWHMHHKCKNTSCVNPDHLEAIHPDQHRVEHFLNERTGLTVDDLKEMRRRMRDINTSVEDLAVEYGVSSETAHVIKRGERWVDVIGESGPVVVDNPRACPNCGETVERKNRNALYCSVKCRVAFNQRKPAARKRQNEAQNRRREAARMTGEQQ
jgi:hypothetical protein